MEDDSGEVGKVVPYYMGLYIRAEEEKSSRFFTPGLTLGSALVPGLCFVKGPVQSSPDSSIWWGDQMEKDMEIYDAV